MHSNRLLKLNEFCWNVNVFESRLQVDEMSVLDFILFKLMVPQFILCTFRFIIDSHINI
jgi:hypothetical protein